MGVSGGCDWHLVGRGRRRRSTPHRDAQDGPTAELTRPGRWQCRGCETLICVGLEDASLFPAALCVVG